MKVSEGSLCIRYVSEKWLLFFSSNFHIDVVKKGGLIILVERIMANIKQYCSKTEFTQLYFNSLLSMDDLGNNQLKWNIKRIDVTIINN